MIYVKRLLWLVFYLPVLVIATWTFVVGLFLCPIILGVYYIKDGTIRGCEFEPDTLAKIVDRFYQRLQPKVK